MSFDAAVGELRRTNAHIEANPPEAIVKQNEVLNEFQPVFELGHIDDLTKEEFLRFLPFKNNKHWTGLARQGPNMTSDMEQLREGLNILLDEELELASRVTEAKNTVDGMGKGTLTAILLVAYPDKYGVWNNKSEAALRSLGIFPEFDRGETFGSKYETLNHVLQNLAKEVNVDLWTLDALFHFVLDLSEEELEGEEEAPGELTGEFVAEEHLHRFLIENWDGLPLSREWEIYSDADDPQAGVEYPTDVGPMDLLLQHKNERRLRVVELKKAGSSDRVVGQILRYVGWIKSHLDQIEGADSETDVDGLIITRRESDRLQYALKAVPGVKVQNYEVDFKLSEP